MVIWREIEFDLDVGVLCLDFANTADRWEDGTPVEHEPHALTSYEAVVAFARAAGIVDDGAAETLVERAAAQPAAEAGALQRARSLREAIFGTVLARIEDHEPEPAHLDQLNAIYKEGLRHRRLVWRGDALEVEWAGLGEDLESVLWPIADSAVQLLVGEDMSRVRHCGGSDCDWLFVDRTRNRSRRWCSMSSCGNRAKAKRHYEKKRGLS